MDTVADIIAALQKLPPTDYVVKDGPDGGYNDIELERVLLVKLVDDSTDVIGFQQYQLADEDDDQYRGEEFWAWRI